MPVETFPVLYILMRNDMASMNAGKAMAQASHASNAFWKAANEGFLDKSHSAFQEQLLNEWQLSTSQGFGTVLVLAVNGAQMNTAVDVATALGFMASVIHDPTYPILVPTELGSALAEMDNHNVFSVGEKNNYVTIPLDTCAYIFGDKNDPMLSAVVGRFPLHP